ncbi:hypothetical protein CTZ27_29495 [Streptomyces griseocarneus]|nr:hypothetical protein CTZ27_29495 [Streptomyces griseocarneus]
MARTGLPPSRPLRLPLRTERDTDHPEIQGDLMWAIPFLLCGALVAVGAWRLRGGEPGERPSPPEGLTAHGIPLYDAAYLGGGAPRAALTALVVMRLGGRLILSRSGTLTVTDPVPRNDLEAAVIAVIGDTRRRELGGTSREILRGRAIGRSATGWPGRG